jgi:DNA-binding MarR family transcriptional regulator
MALDEADRSSQIRRVGRLSLRMAEVRNRNTPQAFARAGLTVPQMRVLFVVARERGARPGAISTATGIAPPNVTALLSRLEERGLILRRPDPEDGRATIVELTQHGRDVRRDLIEAGHEDLADAMATLSDEELEALELGLGALVRALEERLERLQISEDVLEEQTEAEQRVGPL